VSAQLGVMRVTGGVLAGRRLHAPRGEKTRPTAARARKGLFDWLGGHLENARVLDLFAGTGSLGIEALSRSAARSVFVERDTAALAALRRNVAGLSLAAHTEVLASEVTRALVRLASSGRCFDLVLADPPYAESLSDLAGRVQLARVLDSDGVLIVERRTRGPGAALNAQEIVGLHNIRSRAYGQTVFDWYERAHDPSDRGLEGETVG